MNQYLILAIAGAILGVILAIPYFFIKIYFINRNRNKKAMEVLKNVSEEEHQLGRIEGTNKTTGIQETTSRGSGSSRTRIRGRGRIRRAFGRIFGRRYSQEEDRGIIQGRESSSIDATSRDASEQRKIQIRNFNNETTNERQSSRDSNSVERSKQPFKSAFD